MIDPAELKYTETHEWVAQCAEDGEGVLRIGITDFAQSEMGDLVFIGMPAEGDEVEAGESFAEVESVKAVSEVLSPVSGTVTEVNEELDAEPGKVNSDPFGSWFVKVQVEDVQAALEGLMDAAAYEALDK